MPIRLDLYRLQRAARQKLSRDGRSPEERRLDELRPVPSISSLTNIGVSPLRWTCPDCGLRNRASFDACDHCGCVRSTSTRVRS